MKSILLRPALITLIAFLLSCIVDEGFQIETRLGLDALFQLRGGRKPPDNVLIVTIDEASDKEYDIGTNFTLWRGKHAALIKALHNQGAALILFDFYFSDPQPDVDPTLAKAMAKAGNVLAVDCVQTERNGWGLCGHKPPPAKPIEIYPPTPELAAALLDHAPFFLGDDAGNYVVRQNWTFIANKPSLPVIAWLQQPALKNALSGIPQLPRSLSEWASGQRKQCQSQVNSGFFAPLKKSSLQTRLDDLLCQGETRFIDYYGPPKTLSMLSYSDVREGRIKGLNGKTVFVGQVPRKTLPGVDSFVTPFTDTNSGKMAGVELMATVFSNLVEGREINTPMAPGLIMALFGLIVSIMLTRYAGLIGIALSIIFSVLYLTLAVAVFKRSGLWLPIATPLLLQLPVACFLSLYWSRLDQLGETKQLKARIEQLTVENNRLIQQFIDQLNHTNPLTLSLSGEEISEKQFGTCLVTDIEEYVGIAERTPPDILINRLREYFKLLGERISVHGGKIVNIAGDGMVAIWIDPVLTSQQQSACLASVAMKQAIDRFNSFPNTDQLITRFGLHEGEFAIGRVNSHRLEDNLFGDAINTASRIEGANKFLDTRILASAAIANKVSELILRPVGTFLLKGKHQPLDLVEIVGIESGSSDSNLAIYRDFNKGLTVFRKGHWKQALAIFKRLQAQYGYDGPANYYIEKFANQEKPPADWQGYITLESK